MNFLQGDVCSCYRQFSEENLPLVCPECDHGMCEGCARWQSNDACKCHSCYQVLPRERMIVNRLLLEPKRECCVCMEQVSLHNTPVIGECGHSVCKACVGKIIGMTIHCGIRPDAVTAAMREKRYACALCQQPVLRYRKCPITDTRVDIGLREEVRRMWSRDLRFLFDAMSATMPAETLARSINEYRKLMYLKGDNRDTDATVYSPCVEVDAVWHQHILHTREYQAFCASAFREPAFMHHRPDGANEEDAKFARYQRTLVGLMDCFASIDPLWVSHDFLRNYARADEAATPHTMQLFVKTMSGVTRTFIVKPNEKIWEVKLKVFAAEGIEMSQQRLIYAGGYMDAHRSLMDYGNMLLRIAEASKAHLAGTTVLQIQLNVRREDGSWQLEEVDCAVRPKDTIYVLKERLQLQLNRPAGNLRFDGYADADVIKLRPKPHLQGVWSIGVTPEATLHLVLPLRGC